jgi:hypothetical protein
MRERSRQLRARSRLLLAGAAVFSLLLGACSGDRDDDGASTRRDDAATTTPSTVARPAGPASDLSEELTAGSGVFIGSALAGQLDAGYVEHEYVAAGTATSYQVSGEMTSDGRWTFEPDTSAEYRTRVLVRRPEDPDDFSGVVLVEWLNVSGGVDADPGFVTTHEEIARQGHAWVGVSAQALGVNGGTVLVRVDAPGAADVVGKGLRAIDPARYGSLEHPGDAYAYDIYTQVARGLREDDDVFGGVEPVHVLALGQSQSAAALVTYINGVQPLTRAFDAFFVHSRGGSGLPLAEPGESADLAGTVGRPPAILRTDTDVPIVEFQTESDITSVLGSLAARQPDTDSFRLWEVAGTAHADTRLLGENVSAIDCGVPVNDGPQHVVAKAALRHLVTWVTEGDAPPEAPRLEVTEGADPDISRDADGIALGGVRTPPVDVPVRVLSSEQGPTASVICLLLGSTTPLPADRITELYTSRDDYEQGYAAAIDRAIEAGFVLDDDRAAIEEYAHADLVPE